jgi:hypothetical protein
MSEVDMQPVVSSNVAACGYDEEASECYVQFKSGGTYIYEGVNRSTYDELLASDSPGRYVNQNLKGSYTARRG